jgi:hypothetical protein
VTETLKLAADETELVGEWQSRGPRITSDAICARIERLISDYLVSLGTDESGWDALYRDPVTGRLWELTWPQSDQHGGGPPRLRLVHADEVRPKYGPITDG